LSYRSTLALVARNAAGTEPFEISYGWRWVVSLAAPAGLIGRSRTIPTASVIRSAAWFVTTVACIVHLLVCRIPLHTSENIVVKLDGPMTFGYRVDAINAASKLDGAAQTSASHVERERYWMDADFAAALAALPEGYSEGISEGRRYLVSFRRSGNGRRNSLIARKLAGTDIVSFNLYRSGPGNASLKPYEISSEKVRDFVLGFRLSASSASVSRIKCPT